MNTPTFSTTFVAYNGEGVPFTFTVSADTLDAFLGSANALLNRYPMLGGFGMMTPQPLEASVRPKTFHIVGWLRGETNNRFDPTQPNPCVWLYSNLPWLDFAVATVYAEDLPKLPIDWQSAQSVGGAPPPADKAKHRWIATDFDILMLPVFAADGTLETGKTGKTKYRFAEVIAADSAGHSQHSPDDGFEAVGTPVGQAAPPPALAPLPANTFTGLVKPPAQSTLPPPTQAQRPAPSAPVATAPPPPSAPENGEKIDVLTLMEYARGFADPENVAALEAATVAMIHRMRALDANSMLSMTVNSTLPDGKHKRGQYEFMAGVIDKIIKDATDYDDMHKQVLSFIFGKPISKGNPPGEQARALFDEIYAGTEAQPSTVMNQSTRDAIIEIAYVAKGIEDRLKEDAKFGRLPPVQSASRQSPVPTAAPIPAPPRAVAPMGTPRPAPPKQQTIDDDIPF